MMLIGFTILVVDAGIAPIINTAVALHAGHGELGNRLFYRATGYTLDDKKIDSDYPPERRDDKQQSSQKIGKHGRKGK